MFWLRMAAATIFFTALLPYCPTALLPYCPTALLK
ncbi:hypothetical protein P036_03045 [Brucella canis 04-2330-1]|nr:hypothetical protein P036_03045 [Brucella canis 04-2330-1]